MDHLVSLKQQVKGFFKARRLSNPPARTRLEDIGQPSQASSTPTPSSDSITARLSRLAMKPEKPGITTAMSASPKPMGARPMFAKSITISTQKIFDYMRDFPQLGLLFLDIRSHQHFEASHIGAQNVVNIDPIVCRPNANAQDLEDSFAIGPPGALDIFQRRNEFDLVIYYDYDSRSLLSSEATNDNYHPEALQNLHKALWEYGGWRKPLRRAPVLLLGGLAAWKAAGGALSTARTSSTQVDEPSLRRPPEQTAIVLQKPVHSSHAPTAKAVNRGTSLVESAEPTYPRSVHEYIFSDAARQQSMVSGAQSPSRPPNFSRPSSYLRSPTKSVPEPLPSKPVSSPYLEARQPPEGPRRLGAAPVYHRQPSLGSQASRLGQTTIGKTGLKNLGNSCFMNSVLQCLAACYPLARYFTSGQWRNDVSANNPMGYKGAIAKEFAKVLRDLSSDDNAVVAPIELRNELGKSRPEFANNEQQDAQELLNFALDAIHEDLNAHAMRPQLRELNEEEEFYRETLQDSFVSETEWKRHMHRNMSIIVKLFQGQFQSRLRCLTCGHTSTTYNAFSSLSLPIPSKKAAVTLEDCVNEFVKPEAMSGDDSWFCTKCKTKRNASKKLTISRLPDVLVIHFKRFESKGPWRDKLNTNISYPLTGLDMTQYLGPDMQNASPAKSVYDVFGIVYHRGSMEGGHYTAMVNPDAQNARDWTLFDDSRVAPSNEIDGRASYLLFYTKRPTMM